MVACKMRHALVRDARTITHTQCTPMPWFVRHEPLPTLTLSPLVRGPRTTASATANNWNQKVQHSKQEGYYLLRTTLDANQEEIQWQIYNVVREVESTFRILKPDLDLRPIYHKTDKAAMAHLHPGLLAYWLVNTIRHQLKQKGIHTQWKEIVRVMNTQKLVTTTMQNEYSQTIVLRKYSESTKEAS